MKPQGRWLLGGVGVAILLAALAFAVTRRRLPPQAPQDASPEPDDAGASLPGQPPPRASKPQTGRSAPAGLQLGARREAGRQSTAQAIYRAALLELQRMDTVDESRARDAYLRGRAALERVEDELGQDDEPGHAQLRADIDALDTQMRRLYDEPDP